MKRILRDDLENERAVLTQLKSIYKERLANIILRIEEIDKELSDNDGIVRGT